MAAAPIINLLSAPRLLNYVLPTLMVYLLIGTVAQKYIGLYEATKIFFSSPVIWLSIIPLPGFPVLIALIFINLTCKLIFKSPWSLKNSGIIITHISVLLLLLGGLFTALFSHEGFVDLSQNDAKSLATDYHKREFVIKNENNEPVFAINHKNLKENQVLTPENISVRVKILEHCRNCKIEKRQDADESYIGMAQHMRLTVGSLQYENEENMAGLTLELSGGDEGNGVYVALENVPQNPQFTLGDETYTIMVEKQRRDLPFKIELLQFKRENHPGSPLAKAYSSYVRIHDGPSKWESRISMNEPLRYKGYSIYQSSFIETSNGDVSVLSVVWNAGRAFPYISGIAMCIGIIVHVFARRYATLALLALMFAGLFPSSAAYAQDLDMSSFSRIPVMHEGRIKPIESFARSMQKEFSGQNQGEATAWLAGIIFDPAKAENTPIIKITNPDLLNILSISRKPDKLYSYKQIADALEQKQDILLSIIDAPQEDWTPAQRDFVRLQKKTVLLADLLSSASLFLPLSVVLGEAVPSSLKAYAGKQMNYLEALEFKETLQSTLGRIVKRKGEDIERYTNGEKSIALFSFALANIQVAGERSQIFRVLPAEEQKQAWLSPWEAVLRGSDKDTFKNWQSLAESYNNGDWQSWSSISQEVLEDSMRAPDLSANALKIEHVYVQVEPLKISIYLYSAALCLLLIALFLPQLKAMQKTAVGAISAGLFLHIAAITARVYILERPPVSTLYESVIFVGFVVALYALISYIRNKEDLWLYIAAAAGIFFHILGFSHDQDRDSMMMLTAVLNTNFWLATHVICITAGYAFCALTSILAHYALYMRALAQNAQQALSANIKTLALVSLLFSAVGTVLGGIWADQSWGRFWGWDPKENGALLIVLWLIWFLHGRISGQMSERFMHAGLAYLSVIVALSWFGVNLLSVGLHAYGFTDGLGVVLGLFVAFETVLISGLMWWPMRKARTHAG